MEYSKTKETKAGKDGLLIMPRKGMKRMGITKADLGNLVHLDKEIEEIDDQIDKLTNKIYRSGNYTGDTIRDYSLDASGKIVVIRGYNHKRYEKQLKHIITAMDAAKEQYLEQLDKIAKNLNEIPEAEIRRIIRLKFVDHLGWKDVAAKIGPYATADSVRKRFERYLSDN